MTQAGLVYTEDGRIEDAIWSFEKGQVIVTAMSGDQIIKMTEKEFRLVLTEFCQSEPK